MVTASARGAGTPPAWLRDPGPGAEARPFVGRALLVSGFVLALVVLGYACHPIPAAHYENDGYVLQAEAILAGSLPHDDYRPALYPLLVAGLGWLTGDCFVAARIVSSIAAGLLVLFSHALARLCFGGRAALLTGVLVAVHPKVVVLGIQAITDPLFTAAAVATVFFAAASVTDRRLRVVVLTALSFAISYFTRYTAIALLAPIAIALLCPRGSGWRERRARLATFSLFAILFLLPHFVLTQIQFGSPWHNESWRSMALKYYGNLDWSYLRNMPFASLGELIAHDPMLILSRGSMDLWWYLKDVLGEQLLGHPGSNPWGVLGVLLGIGLGIWKRGLAAAVGLAFAAVYIVMICVTFYPQDRLMLPAIAVLLGPIGCVVSRVRTAPHLPEWAARWTSRLLAGLLVLSLVSQFPAELRAFAARHPTAEVAALQRLSTQFGDARILSMYPYAVKYVHPPARALRLLANADGTAEEALALTAATARSWDARFAVLGSATAGPLWEKLLAVSVTGTMRVLEQREDLLVLTIENDLARRIEGFTVSPHPFTGGTFHIDMTLAPGFDPLEIRCGGVLMVDPAQNVLPALLPRPEPRTFHISVTPPEQLPTGVWKVFPWFETFAGWRGYGHAVLWEVRAP